MKGGIVLQNRSSYWKGKDESDGLNPLKDPTQVWANWNVEDPELFVPNTRSRSQN